MTIAIGEIPLTCATCQKVVQVKPTVKGAPRPPNGWKRLADPETGGDLYYCPDCKHKLWRLCAITFPVAEVLEGGTWQEFGVALRDAWACTGRLANWAVRQLYAADGERQPGQGKILPLPRLVPSLYERWQAHHERGDWQGSTTAANSVLHAVEAKYREGRYAVLWLGQDQLPRYRFPTPYPIHNQGWQARYHEVEGANPDGTTHTSRVPVVRLNLGGRTWIVRIRGGPEMRRQLVAFAHVVSGSALKGELALYRKRASTGSHRRTMSEKASGGGNGGASRIMLKMVAYLPRGERRQGLKGTLLVRTARNALLVAEAPGASRPWLFHADYLRREVHAHMGKLQAIADDLKAENRPAGAALKGRLETLSRRHRNRMDSELRRIVAVTVKYALRCRLEGIEYDDSERGYAARIRLWPWAELRRMFKEACDRDGLAYKYVGKDDDEDESASGEVVDETPAAARGNGEAS